MGVDLPGSSRQTKLDGGPCPLQRACDVASSSVRKRTMLDGIQDWATAFTEPTDLCLPVRPHTPKTPQSPQELLPTSQA